jgi:hypothetical protein
VQRPLRQAPRVDDAATVSETVAAMPAAADADLLIAALPQADGNVGAHYSPALLDRVLEPTELDGAFVRPLPEAIRRHGRRLGFFASDPDHARSRYRPVRAARRGDQPAGPRHQGL